MVRMFQTCTTQCAVDLCVAPGSWSQILARKLYPHSVLPSTASTSSTAAVVDAHNDAVKIIVVDLQAMAPIPGIEQLQGDITKVIRMLKFRVHINR